MSVALNIVVGPSGAAALAVSWDVPLDDGGEAVDSYEVVWRSDRDGYDDFWTAINMKQC